MTIDNYLIVQKGATANLIVPDGVTLNCTKGIGCGLNKSGEYASLNIYGSGKIIAGDRELSAGIGGDNDETNGSITIHGTTIEATGGHHGAGIGGGEGGKKPDSTTPAITIFGADVTATGGIDGADIGGGDSQPGARTYVFGGKKQHPVKNTAQASAAAQSTPRGAAKAEMSTSAAETSVFSLI